MATPPPIDSRSHSEARTSAAFRPLRQPALLGPLAERAHRGFRMLMFGLAQTRLLRGAPALEKGARPLVEIMG